MIYFVPLIKPFNAHPFIDDSSTGNNINTLEILNKYAELFKEAWIELANKEK